MKPTDEPRSLKSLEEDIARFQSKSALSSPRAPQGTGVVMRMGTELASGVLVGAGVGILLDRWLGTSPVLCILCFLLGATAGLRLIWRTSQSMEAMVPVTKDEMPRVTGDEDDD